MHEDRNKAGPTSSAHAGDSNSLVSYRPAPDTAEVTFMNAFTKKLRGHDGILSVERYDTAAWRAADARFQKYY